ncbi:MAG: trypsin-like serine protease [Myxococcota bacterium]
MLSWSWFLLANAASPLGVAPAETDGADATEPTRPLGPDREDPQGVVGGDVVPEGDWDDAVGVVFSDQYVGCTGTLIGPRVVLTAGHCVRGIDVTKVLVGSKNWALDGGELIEVEGAFEYPNSQSAYDVAVLTLKEPASAAPRALAMDCILRDYLEDGAPVDIVGFGLTTEAGVGWNTWLHEARSAVLDKDCDEPLLNNLLTGCHLGISPGGEIAAGGDGVDACFGDSGGPLYLDTERGAFLVGVTSRGFLGASASAPCRDGGIWVRPDAVVPWIEETVGDLAITYPVCNEPPEVVAPEIVTPVGVVGATRLQVVDPDGEPALASAALAEPPEHGEVEVDGLTLRYRPEAGFVGADRFTVAVTDGGTDKPRTGAPVTVEQEVVVAVFEPGEAPAGCGCRTGGTGSLAWLGLLAFTARRRTAVTRA